MSRDGGQQALLERMHEVVRRRAGHVAVREHGRSFTYAEFGALVDGLYRALGRDTGPAATPLGLLLERSAFAYAAMWAAIARGRAYVPLNTGYPQARLQNIIRQAGLTTVVCDPANRDLATALGIDADRQLLPPVAPDGDDDAPHWWQGSPAGDCAYLLFTSGSTGQPKGVPISYANLLAFVDNMDAAIAYRQDDVCSQVCELSFDFSVQEIYLALLNGCTLCPARRVDLFDPARYIASRSISVWIAVPSFARVILGNGVALGDSLQRIRLSIFNGEALTAGVAAAWREAAPNTEIWNSYGPTECTVAVTVQRWSGEAELEEAGVIAIGTPFPDCRTALLRDADVIPTAAAADGDTGELLLATPQRFGGYIDRALPAPFVTDGAGTCYYRTGDRVLWRDGRLFHLGRVDYQVKIGGHRIELLEIEQQLRRVLDTEAVAVIAHPARLPTELVLFVAGVPAPPALDTETLRLPAYMLPKRTIVLDRLPTNAHGKLDRVTLHTLADARH